MVEFKPMRKAGKRKRDEARPFAKLYRDIWRDPDFRELTSTQQNVYFLILSSEQRNNLGVADYVPARFIGMASDWTIQSFDDDVQALEQSRHLVVDREYSEVMIRTYNRNDDTLSSPNFGSALGREYADLIFSPLIKQTIISELAFYWRTTRHLDPEEYMHPTSWQKLAERNPAMFEEIQQHTEAVENGVNYETGELHTYQEYSNF